MAGDGGRGLGPGDGGRGAGFGPRWRKPAIPVPWVLKISTSRHVKPAEPSCKKTARPFTVALPTLAVTLAIHSPLRRLAFHLVS